MTYTQTSFLKSNILRREPLYLTTTGPINLITEYINLDLSSVLVDNSYSNNWRLNYQYPLLFKSNNLLLQPKSSYRSSEFHICQNLFKNPNFLYITQVRFYTNRPISTLWVINLKPTFYKVCYDMIIAAYTQLMTASFTYTLLFQTPQVLSTFFKPLVKSSLSTTVTVKSRLSTSFSNLRYL